MIFQNSKLCVDESHLSITRSTWCVPAITNYYVVIKFFNAWKTVAAWYIAALASKTCLSLTRPVLIPYRGKGSGTWPQSNLSPRNLISHVNPVMTSAMAVAKVRLATFLHSRFQFLLCSSSCLKTLLAQFTSHTSSSCSTQTEILNFPVNIMWLNTVLWLVFTPRYGATNCSMAMSTLSLGAE